MEKTIETESNVENGSGIPYFIALVLKIFGLHIFYGKVHPCTGAEALYRP